MSGTSLIEADILTRLRSIVDPCSERMGRPMNLVQMGLVDHVDVSDGVVTVRLLLTDASCFFFFDFSDRIRGVLSNLPDVRRVDVELAEDKLWTPGRIGLPLGIRPRSEAEER